MNKYLNTQKTIDKKMLKTAQNIQMSKSAAQTTTQGGGCAALDDTHLSNRWAENSEAPKEYIGVEKFEPTSQFIFNSRKELLEQPLRRNANNLAFIDTISFTFHEDTLKQLNTTFMFSDEEYILKLSEIMEGIFGFGISEKAEHPGNRFYKNMYLCKSPDSSLYASVYYGGQQDTILIELKGVGCLVAQDGWELRLFEFLNKATRPKITRVDVTVDFFNGEYTADKAYRDWQKGEFNLYGRKPMVDKFGPDWENGTKQGKTLYIGSKNSTKQCCIYEKGKKLGDQASKWLRFEIRFGKKIKMPLDVLLYPSQYFVGAFPICTKFAKRKEYKKTKTVENLALKSYETALKNMKKQAGRMINFLKGIYGDDYKTIVEKLSPNHDKLPKRLLLESFHLINFNSIHKQEPYQYIDDFGLTHEKMYI